MLRPRSRSRHIQQRWGRVVMTKKLAGMSSLHEGDGALLARSALSRPPTGARQASPTTTLPTCADSSIT